VTPARTTNSARRCSSTRERPPRTVQLAGNAWAQQGEHGLLTGALPPSSATDPYSTQIETPSKLYVYSSLIGTKPAAYFQIRPNTLLFPLLKPAIQGFLQGSLSIWGVMSHRGFLKLWVTEESGNDDTCRRFFCETQPDSDIGSDAPLFDLLPPSSFVLVDRLGRSGRCKFPIAEHYSPYIKARFNQAKKGYLCLPPSGALLNPIELAWCELKRRVCLILTASSRPAGPYRRSAA
jgi:hypothetical protein